jgi:spermidine synthase
MIISLSKVIVVLYFFSGAAGLLYEVAWFRRLQLVFGVSAFAMGAVVAAFMLGLAAGSRWAGAIRLVRDRPLLAYATQEGGLALYALLFSSLVRWIEQLYSMLFPVLGGHFFALSAIRLVLSLLVLLPPTFCMGATLPTLGQAMIGAGANLSRSVGWLYAINTFGAVVGTLTAGFFALEHLGIQGTIWLAALINAGIASVALILALRPRAMAISPPGKVRIRPRGADGVAAAENLRLALAAVACTGFVSMALEVIWTRALVFYVHNSTYAFSAILAVYLFGLAAGSAVAAALSTRAKSPKGLGWVLILSCLSTLVAIAVYRNVPALAQPFLGEKLAAKLAGLSDRSFWIVRSWRTALASIFMETGAVLLLPTFVFGLVFPLALRLAQGSTDSAKSVVGRLYAWNTFGGVAGTLFAAFASVALLGTRGSLLVLAWLPLPIGLWLLHKGSNPPRFRWGIIVSGVAALAIVTLVAAPSGFYRQMFERRFGPVLWFSEGAAETVAVCRHPDKSDWIHYSDGRGASGTTSFRGGWLYAHIPLLLHPEPHSALVICFGTGNTLGAASLHHLDRLDGVELSREVVKASSFFKESNHDVAHAPGVHITIEDGRNYLLGTQTRYDVITEEPPLVHTAGVVNLYSRDFYDLCRAHLTGHGMMAVWLATWEMEEPEVKMLARAFVEAFPFVSVWDSKHLGEWILIGSMKTLSVDPEKLQQRMNQPLISADLAKLGLHTPADLLALYLKGPEFLAQFTRGVPAVTDDRTVVDYTTPRLARANFGLGESVTGGLNLSGVSQAGLVSELRVRSFDAIYTHRDRPDSLLSALPEPSLKPLLAELDQRRAQDEAESGKKLAWNLMLTASDYQVLGQWEKGLQILDSGTNLVDREGTADLLVMKAILLQKHGQLENARQALARALEIKPDHPKARQLATWLLP